ncbi:MAG: phage tail protein [Candidatus Liberibacter europaeus]|uniref:Phage tail protein n=1 Tax=Candidatus Liberibacter europaeus TaxID=744859 RepID=A0A2T4VW51_9HYPH|nr:MAG: phage tail protein [Candidatus Liberibacter europaeus]
MIKSNDLTAKQIDSRFKHLKSGRSELDEVIKELSSLLYPYKGSKKSNMWDTTGSEACIKLSSLLSSLITPAGQRWHGLSEPYFSHQLDYLRGASDAKKIKEWCDAITDVLFSFRERSGSGFVSCLHAFYKSIVEVGTGCMYIEADVDNDGIEHGIRYIAVPLDSVYISVNHQNAVDSVYRKFKFTAEQIAHKWGEDALSSSMRASLEQKEDDKFNFIHAVYPKGIGRSKGFHSKFVCTDESRFLEEKELSTLPYAIGRYSVRADEIYGKSPAMEALPAIRRLNEIQTELAKFSILSIQPPYNAVANSLQTKFKQEPRAINYGAISKEGKELFKPVPVGNPIPYYQEIERIEKSIQNMFLLNLFQILDDKASRSAAESLEKTREKGAFVAPLLGGIQSEFIGMMIRRELDILDLQKQLPEFGDLRIQVLKVEYTSPLFKYQQAEVVASAFQGANNLIELAIKSGNPEIMDYLDFETFPAFTLYRSGCPAQLICDSKKVEEKRKERKNQMQQMMEREKENEQTKISNRIGEKVVQNEIKESVDHMRDSRNE